MSHTAISSGQYSSAQQIAAQIAALQSQLASASPDQTNLLASQLLNTVATGWKLLSDAGDAESAAQESGDTIPN